VTCGDNARRKSGDSQTRILTIDGLQADLDVWVREHNEARPRQGRWCFGKTPMQTLLDAMPMTKEKMIAA
jgi:hypothetical protein